MKPPALPPLELRAQSGLSETLTGPKAPNQCQACGRFDEPRYFQRWIEHDAWDRSLGVVVVLCPPCGRKLIDKHPRLYALEDVWAPRAGVMPCCIGCVKRDGIRCTHPDLKANGGAGLRVAAKVASEGILCGGRGGCQNVVQYGGEPTCDGRTVVQVVA